MALGRAADRRVARHVRDRVGRQRAEPDVRAEPRRGEGRLASRVARRRSTMTSNSRVVRMRLRPHHFPIQNRAKMCVEHIVRRAPAGDLLERARAPPADRRARTPPAATPPSAARRSARASSASCARSTSAMCRTLVIAGRSREQIDIERTRRCARRKLVEARAGHGRNGDRVRTRIRATAGRQIRLV